MLFAPALVRMRGSNNPNLAPGMGNGSIPIRRRLIAVRRSGLLPPGTSEIGVKISSPSCSGTYRDLCVGVGRCRCNGPLLLLSMLRLSRCSRPSYLARCRQQERTSGETEEAPDTFTFLCGICGSTTCNSCQKYWLPPLSSLLSPSSGECRPRACGVFRGVRHRAGEQRTHQSERERERMEKRVRLVRYRAT